MPIFTLPVSGKAVEWQPMKVGREVELRIAFPGEVNRYRLGIELLLSRITAFDGKPGGIGETEWKSWDAFDMEAFEEEVTVKEAARRAALLKKRADEGAVTEVGQRLRNALTEFDGALAGVAVAAKQVAEAVALWEQERVPLQPKPSP